MTPSVHTKSLSVFVNGRTIQAASRCQCLGSRLLPVSFRIEVYFGDYAVNQALWSHPFTPAVFAPSSSSGGRILFPHV